MVLRRVLQAVSASDRVARVVRAAGPAGFGAGRTAEEAVTAVAGYAADGLPVTVDRLGPPARTQADAEDAVKDTLALLDALTRRGLAKGADILVRLPMMGLGLDLRLARRGADRVCEVAAEAGATVTLDADAVTADPVLGLHSALLTEHPSLGVVVHAALHDAEEICGSLASGRVLLTRGGDPVIWGAPAYATAHEADLSYVRCLRVLMAGSGTPVISTRDRRLIEIASALAVLNEREPDGFEFLVPQGPRPAGLDRQPGSRVRVHVPYGGGWSTFAPYVQGLPFAQRWRPVSR
ncbi:proline dehydrogenase family protein [Sphaerisporangium rubeum]|uniref:Proline dehydrogenase n=1 Tax=Sphaerisporangium rubeum TaxID=321317 RepID=A0A7X0ICV2_9ACTN|nr:proline dehydrogenase [Sphaerisporangium rubeum]MBB6471342.1 proline dehydrogenase [Sphaerisporangium rubeum]